MSAFSNKNVLITGTASGIGRAMAVRFAAAGACVVGLDVDSAGNEETRAIAGTSFHSVIGDAAEPVDARLAAAQLGVVDILINNAAAVAGDGALHEVSEQAWDRTVRACLKPVYSCTHAVLPAMIARQVGVILSISSVNALSGIHLSAYSAAKGAIISLTRVLAQHYGGFGIRANVICPGTIETEMSRQVWEQAPELRQELAGLYPAGRFGTPEHVAACALWLASEEAGFVNGATLVVDGGMSAVHRLPAILPKPNAR
jgi:NAD(P)-dependent dehydrogenase (short-subunit alcohol dehydrogenase family)